jgi:hypothetical protein
LKPEIPHAVTLGRVLRPGIVSGFCFGKEEDMKKRTSKRKREPFIPPRKLTPEELEELRAEMKRSLKVMQELNPEDQASPKEGGKDAG